MWGGAHFNISAMDGAKVGEAVGESVDAHWAVQPPSGVMPSPTCLKVDANLPQKQTRYNSMRLVF
uniref:Uncharacterized protein n=1 Tax=Physcomitrium patens TaxID=3218 RepID=A0A2K1IJ55_PHYPA|nr:hypothetical protein PHYPA_027995 [Physcomitrium patens]